MNKDVIYVEPEDDITDIITKIENSTEKITVLVPPKKASVFRSVVNIKLIAKAAQAAEKTVVLVTVDPSIIKLAAASHIPVTKDLKTPPTIPTLDDEPDDTTTEIIEEEEIVEVATDEPVEKPAENSDEDATEDEVKKTKKTKKSSKNFKEWIKNHKIQVIIGAVVLVGLIAFLIWAFVFAPAATINVEVQTELKSFSENVSFTTNPSQENAKEGIFYLEQKTTENAQEVKFDATGKKNEGEKAAGNITVSALLAQGGSITISGNNTFTSNGLNFTPTSDVTLSYPKKSDLNLDLCDEQMNCTVSGTVSVTAAAPGTQYNVGNTTNWTNNAGVSVVSSEIGGGTDKEVTIVEQIDVENAKNQLKNDGEDQIKQKLYDTVDKNSMMIIESSFNMETSNATATPGVGEEVGSGVTPVLKAVTTASVYIVDKAKIEDFIREKAKIGDDQRVYEINNFYIENFSGSNGKFSGRLKTNYNVGPKMSESEIVDMVKGKGLGDIQHDLKNINGVVSVNIETSFPWVSVAPSDSNKITVNLNVKENGNKGVNSSENSGDNSNNGSDSDSGSENGGEQWSF